MEQKSLGSDMSDREKVMKGLQCLSSPYAQDMNGRDCENCQYDNASCFLDITADALALLKEQPEIVRCEDCKHRPTYPKAYGAEINGHWCYWCELHRMWATDDWFCADGERV